VNWCDEVIVRTTLDFLYMFFLTTLFLRRHDDWVVDEDVDGTTFEPRWCCDRLAAGHCQGQIRSRRINGCVDIDCIASAVPSVVQVAVSFGSFTGKRTTQNIQQACFKARKLEPLSQETFEPQPRRPIECPFLCSATPTRRDIGTVEPIPTGVHLSSS
jgi:hypothetical protein